MVIAADHTARGILEAGGRSMADRGDLLDRLVLALSRPGVNGVLGTPDILEDLLLLGALDGKVVFGSMNRGGLAGAAWTLDDRFTAYDAAAIERVRFEGGKMLLRLDPDDQLTAPTLEACAHAVVRARRAPPDRDGRAVLARHDARGRDPKAITIASALGHDLGLHVAEGAGRRGDGARDGREHAARADPRRRRAGGLRRVGATRWRCRPCGGS